MSLLHPLLPVFRAFVKSESLPPGAFLELNHELFLPITVHLGNERCRNLEPTARQSYRHW